MTDPVIQPAFYQHIDPHFFQKRGSLFTGQDHIAGSVNSEKHCLFAKCFPLFYFFHQFPVATMYPVKFSHCNCTVGKLRKLTIYLQVFHKSLLSKHFYRIIFFLLFVPLKNTCKIPIAGIHPHPAFLMLLIHQILR